MDAESLAGLCGGLRTLLNGWDPIGVYVPQLDFPPDEYDCLEGPLLARLNDGADVVEISEFLWFQLKDHFGLDPARSKPEDFARKLMAWFRAQDTGPPGASDVDDG